MASYLLLDAFNKDFESAVIVSNDSDLAEPIRIVRSVLGFDVVGVLNPHAANPRSTPAVFLKKVAKFQLAVSRTHVATCQLPSPIKDPKTGRDLHKPAQW